MSTYAPHVNRVGRGVSAGGQFAAMERPDSGLAGNLIGTPTHQVAAGLAEHRLHGSITHLQDHGDGTGSFAYRDLDNSLVSVRIHPDSVTAWDSSSDGTSAEIEYFTLGHPATSPTEVAEALHQVLNERADRRRAAEVYEPLSYSWPGNTDTRKGALSISTIEGTIDLGPALPSHAFGGDKAVRIDFDGETFHARTQDGITVVHDDDGDNVTSYTAGFLRNRLTVATGRDDTLDHVVERLTGPHHEEY